MINNAGTNFVKKITDLETADWNRIIATDLSSVFYMCRAFIPMMKGVPGGGSIVNVASTFGLIGHPEMPVYCAAKGGLVSLTRQLAVDYGTENIRVNSLCPGATLSPRVKHYIDSGMVDGKAVEELALLKRLATCDEVANAAIFLASDAASYIHGTALVVDGGQTVHSRVLKKSIENTSRETKEQTQARLRKDRTNMSSTRNEVIQMVAPNRFSATC